MAGSVHEDKRIGKWFYAIEVGKDPITGRRKQKKKSGFKNKTEARGAMIAAEKDFNEGILIKSSKILVKDFIIDWLETKKST